jgi:hypothetical protein
MLERSPGRGPECRMILGTNTQGNGKVLVMFVCFLCSSRVYTESRIELHHRRRPRKKPREKPRKKPRKKPQQHKALIQALLMRTRSTNKTNPEYIVTLF